MGNKASNVSDRIRRSGAQETPSNIGYYNIWFRHDTEPEIEDIPKDVRDKKVKRVSLEEMMRSTRGLTLTHMYIIGNIPPILDQIAPNLTHLRLIDCDHVEQLERIKPLKNLENLNLSYNKIRRLPSWISELSNLRKLNVEGCGLSSIPDRLISLCTETATETMSNTASNMSDRIRRSGAKITPSDIDYNIGFRHDTEPAIEDFPYYPEVKRVSLEELMRSTRGLTLTHMFIRGNIPPILDEICPHLTHLRLSDCDDVEQLERIKPLKNLEDLDLSNTNIGRLPSWISELSNLRKLNVYNSGLSSLPDSMRQLVKLESLDISFNTISSVPSWIGDLTNLRNLQVFSCGLSTLPESMRQLVKLETLVISYSTISSVPSWIGDLCNLRLLTVRNCGLSTLPESLSKLTNLLWLNVSGNKSLTSIPLSIFSIRSLTKLDCDDCDSLTSPPYAVAKQGLEAIRQYIKALKQEEGNNKRTFVVTVIGKSLAGKTSIVKSIQQNKRVLTKRLVDSRLDQVTKVFQVAELKVSDNESILFFDCGGHDIYHVAYQMTFRTECVTLLIIDIADFDRIASSRGVKEACKEVCMDWLSQLYPSCPKLGRPVVVLTHCDQLTSDTVKLRMEELITTTEILRKNIVDEEINEAGSEMNPVFTMTAFCDMSKPLIASDAVYMFSNTTSTAQIMKLREELTKLGALISMEIPGSWYAVLQYISDQQEKACIPLSEIVNKFPVDKNHYILAYIHEIGKVMWFRNHPTLHQYIFHRTDVLTSMVKILFHHAEEHAWRRRIESFLPFTDKAGQRIQKRKFLQLVNSFLRTGIMDAALLSFLLRQESPFRPALAIDVLKSFHLICGPIQDKASNRPIYILPFFSGDEISVLEEEGCVRLMADIFLNGLPVPVYVYSLGTASFIDLHMSANNHIQSGMNGARVKISNEVTKYLLHNSKKSCLTLVTVTSAGKISDAWGSHLSTIHKLVAKLKSVWKGVRYEVVFYCSHCLMSNNPAPTTQVDPDWFHSDRDLSLHTYTGSENFICVNGQQEDTIPSPLMLPCQSISQNGVKKLEDYLKIISRGDTTQGGIPVVTSYPVTQPTGGVESEQISVEQMLLMMKSGPALLNLNPDTSAANNNNQTVYEVTETRGRALIISNDYNGTRPGSKADYDNIKLMFSKFGFVTAGGHGNFTAKDIVDTIHKETQITDGTGESVHKKLGTFVLVLTSHGGKGSFIGSDGIHLELTDIYQLISPRNFPAMKGKPKMIIVQACSGVKREMLLDDQPPQPPTPANSGSAGDYLHMSTSNYQIDSETQDISVSDLIIMQASFDSFVSARHPVKGSPFIRAIVMAFYRLAHKHHVQDLAEIVRECVMKYGVERTTNNPRTSSDDSGYIAQVPKTVCTFTGLRKLYLRPDARADHHPQEVTHPVYPNPTSTAIIPGPRRFVMEDQEGSDPKTTEYYQWRVVDNSRRVRPTPAPADNSRRVRPTPAPRLSLSPSQDVRPRPTPVPRPTPARRTQPTTGSQPS